MAGSDILKVSIELLKSKLKSTFIFAVYEGNLFFILNKLILQNMGHIILLMHVLLLTIISLKIISNSNVI